MSKSPQRTARSPEVEGVGHGIGPFPTGLRVRNMTFSSDITSQNSPNDTSPGEADSRGHFMFQNLRTLLRNRDSRLEDIVHAKAYVIDDGHHTALDHEWLACFHAPYDRSARDTVLPDLPGGMPVQIEIVTAVWN